jgi:hypothetical protein
LAGSLINTIPETRIRDDARNGVNRKYNRRKRVQTALDNVKKKRYSAGLHVTAQQYLLGPLKYIETLKNGSSSKKTKYLSDLRRNCKNFVH